jgi:hypothetical protein
MKTATHISFSADRPLSRPLVGLIAAGLVITSGFALEPPTVPKAGVVTPAPASNPYVNYVSSLEDRDLVCRAHSVALRRLLTERAAHLREFAIAPTTERSSLAARIEKIDYQIGETEVALETAISATQPGDAPGLAPAPVIDLNSIREQSKRWRRPIYLPAPARLVVPELPAPEDESRYLDYLAERAGDSRFAHALVADVARLLHQRRELAYRHAHSRALERARLENTLRAVSLHLRITASAVTEGAKVTSW